MSRSGPSNRTTQPVGYPAAMTTGSTAGRGRAATPTVGLERGRDRRAGAQALFLVEDGAVGGSARHRLDKDSTTVGRDPRSDICVDQAAVSAYHFVMLRSDDGWCCQDCGSTNATFLVRPWGEEVRLEAGERARVYPGDVIEAGSARLLVEVGTWTFEDWTKTLPLPLAAALDRVIAAEGARGKVDGLLDFFEVLAAFNATIALSVLHTHPPAVDRLRGILGPSSGASLLKPSFWTWRRVLEHAAAPLRQLADLVDASREVSNRLATSSPETPRALVEGPLLSALQQANRLRNTVRHGGFREDETLEGDLSTLSDLLADVRPGLTEVWSDWELGIVQECRHRSGTTEVRFKRLLGSQTGVRWGWRTVLGEPEFGHLYCLPRAFAAPLPLLPFLWVERSDPARLYTFRGATERLGQASFGLSVGAASGDEELRTVQLDAPQQTGVRAPSLPPAEELVAPLRRIIGWLQGSAEPAEMDATLTGLEPLDRID